MTLERLVQKLGHWLPGRAEARTPHGSPAPEPTRPGYCFRVRFLLGLTAHLTSDDEELVLAAGEEQGERVLLRARDRGHHADRRTQRGDAG